jgi:hypothetical protein
MELNEPNDNLDTETLQEYNEYIRDVKSTAKTILIDFDRYYRNLLREISDYSYTNSRFAEQRRVHGIIDN